MNRYFLFIFLLFPISVNAQSMDEKIKTLANEIADQLIKNGGKKVAVTSFDYKGCNTEFGKYLAEELTGNLSVSGRTITVVNQKMLESLLTQNRLTAKGLLEAKNDAAKLGQVSGIDALVYGTITTLGEDIRISVNVVKLPTLTVFGYAKSVFPLTKGITAMLPCIGETSQSGTDHQTQGTDSEAANGNSSTDCRQKNTCTVCATNKLGINIKARMGVEYYLHPNETKCWKDVAIGQNRDFKDVYIYYRDDENHGIKNDRFPIEACKTYMKILSK